MEYHNKSVSSLIGTSIANTQYVSVGYKSIYFYRSSIMQYIM